MCEENIYLSFEEKINQNNPSIKISDVSQIIGSNQKMTEQIAQIELCHFPKGKKAKKSLSALFVVQKILQKYPKCTIQTSGPTDLVICYTPKEKENKLGQWLKTAAIALITFFGAGLSTMGYNNDVDTKKILETLYETFTGTVPNGPTAAEAFYSIGLTFGIFLFLDHIPGKKQKNEEPTPLEIQMDLYETDENKTYVKSEKEKKKEK